MCHIGDVYQKFQIFFTQNFFQTYTFFRPNFFSDPKFLSDTKFIFEPKFFKTKNFFGRKIFGSKNSFGLKKSFGPKIFSDQIFFQTQNFFNKNFAKPFQDEHFRLESCLSTCNDSYLYFLLLLWFTLILAKKNGWSSIYPTVIFRKKQIYSISIFFQFLY